MMVYEPAIGPCIKAAMPGTTNLALHILNRSEGWLAFNGIYNCRPPRGGIGYSTHAEGRAFDLNRALPSGQPDGNPIPAGSPADLQIRKWITRLVDEHVELGVQRILYKETNWRCDRGYQPPSAALARMHQQHVHVEQTREKARTLTHLRIIAVLEEDDDMFTDDDRALLKSVNENLNAWFALNGDMRKKQDAIYVEVADEADRPAGQDTLGSRVVEIAKKLGVT